jgi:hypothetical protein
MNPVILKRPCSPEELTGTWIPFQSEVPGFHSGEEIYHFTPDKIFIWEHPEWGETDKVWRFHYDLDNLTMTCRSGPSKGMCIPAWFEEETLVLEPPPGYKTYSRHEKSGYFGT